MLGMRLGKEHTVGLDEESVEGMPFVGRFGIFRLLKFTTMST